MKLVRPPKDYASIEEFYDELPDVDRRLAAEVDLGREWTEPYALDGPKFSLSLACVTYELYERCDDPSYDIHGRVRVLAIFDDLEEAEFVLDGWTVHNGRGGKRWLRRRLELAVPKYICGHCISRGGLTRGLNPGVTFDPDTKCSTCGHKAWSPDPIHERERLRRPARCS